MKKPYKKGESGSILALSLVGDALRFRSKRRSGYRWAGLLSFEKTFNSVLNQGGKVRPNLVRLNHTFWWFKKKTNGPKRG
jgi:hypothetical protein